MTRKVVAGAAALALIASHATVLPTAAAATFSDVPMNAWYFDYVMDLVDMGIVSGNPDGTFRPDNSLNRAEMAKIAVNVAKKSGVITSEDTSGAPAFRDVPAGEWFTSYVSLAAKNKMFEGYRDAAGNLTGYFGPGNTVNRAEASKVLLLAAGVPEMLTPGAPFMDVASKDWFYAYVTSAYNWSILDGYKTADGKLTGYFGPGDPVTRAQIAKISVLAQDPVDRYTGEHLNDMPNSNVNGGNTNTNTGTGSNMNTNSTPISNANFEVALSASSPAATTLATGTAFNTVAVYDLTAGSGNEDVKVTEVTVQARGFVSDSTINGVVLRDSAGKRHGNIVSFANSKATISFANDPIMVKAGTTEQLKVQLNFSNPAAFTSGTVGVELPLDGMKAWGAASNGMVKVNLAGNKTLAGSIHTLVKGSNIADVQIDSQTISATQQTVDIGQLNREVSKFKVTQSNSQEDVMLTEMTLFNNGNSSDTDIQNIKLVDQNGAVLATVKNTSNRYVTFDLSATPYTIPKGTSRQFSVFADIMNGSTRTVQFVLSNDYDVMIKGASSQAFLLPTAQLSVDTNGFPLGDATGYNTLLINEGTLTLSKATSSPSGEISVGATEVTIAEFKVEAAGEDIEIRSGKININPGYAVTIATNNNGAFDAGENPLKGTIRLVNGSGVTLYSVNAVDSASYPLINTSMTDAVSGFSNFNNFLIVKAGTTDTLKLVVDIADDRGLAGRTLVGSLADLSVKKLASNRTASGIQATGIAANTMSVTAATLTVSKNSAMGDQNIVKGATAQKIGSFNLTTTNAEGVNVSSIAVALDAGTTGLNNLRLMKGSEQLGSTIPNPVMDGATGNNFSVSGKVNVPKSASVSVDVYADVASNATAAGNDFVASVLANGVSGTGVQSSNSITAPAAAVSGQLNVLANQGNVSIAATTATSQSMVLGSGQTDANLFAFSITADNNENMILQRARVAIGNSSRTVSDLKLYRLNGTSSTLLAGPVTINDGIVDFGGFSDSILRNNTATYWVSGNVNTSGSLDSDSEFVGGLYYYEVRGASSGNLVQRQVGTELVGTDAAVAYTANDAVLVSDASAAGAGKLSFVQADTTSLSTQTVEFGATDFAIAAGDRVSLVTSRSRENYAAAGNPAATYQAGDAVIYTLSNSGVTNAPSLGVVTTGGTGAAVAINGAAATATAGEDGGRIAKLDIAWTELVGGSNQSAHRYMRGLPVIQADGRYGLVNTDGTLIGATTFAGNAGGSQALVGQVSVLPYISIETGLSTAVVSKNYYAGDVVFYSTDGLNSAMGIVTAVSATNQLTIAPLGGAAAAVTFTANGMIARLFSARGLGNTHAVEDTDVVLSAQATTATLAPNQTVGKLTVNAQGPRDVSLSRLIVRATGSYDGLTGAAVDSYQLWFNGSQIPGVTTTIGTTPGASNCAVTGAACAGDYVTFTFSSPFVVTAGSSAALEVRANTSLARGTGAPQGSYTYSLLLDGTAGRRDVNNGLRYSYTNGKSTPESITTQLTDAYPLNFPAITI